MRPTVARTERHITVTFETGEAALAVRLYPLTRDVTWGWDPRGRTSSGHEHGGQMEWRFGRLQAQGGPSNRRFYEIMRSLDLDFGDIEAELRQATGYTNGEE